MCPDFWPKDFWPTDISPTDIRPNGYLTDGHLAEKMFGRTDISPKDIWPKIWNIYLSHYHWAEGDYWKFCPKHRPTCVCQNIRTAHLELIVNVTDVNRGFQYWGVLKFTLYGCWFLWHTMRWKNCMPFIQRFIYSRPMFKLSWGVINCSSKFSGDLSKQAIF